MAFNINNYDFSSLSIRDLLYARDLYHLHLMNKKNVVATAVGYYRIRKNEPWPTKTNRSPDIKKFKSQVRTLENSEVRPYSWPAIIVIVEKWEKEKTLAAKNPADLVPKTLFLPDGKAVPVCVIVAEKIQPRGTCKKNVEYNINNNPENPEQPVIAQLFQCRPVRQIL